MNAAMLIAAGVFGSISMLVWATAAVVPLLLHLWNRRQHKAASWAAMEFLLAAVQEQARRMRLEQILLLVLRMAIPVVLALALADPIWQMLPSLGSSLGSRPPHHHLFVFDTSYSMGYEVDGVSRLEQARQIAGEVIDNSPQGDGFTIVLMSNPSEAVVKVPAFSPADALAEIRAIELRDRGADLTTALAIANQTLDSVGKDYPRLQKHNLYFLSDMGATTWQAASSADVRKRIGELEQRAELITIDVGVADAKNAGLVSVRRNTPVITPGSPATWQVSVDDFAGLAAGKKQSIEMVIDGNLVEARSSVLSANEPTSVAFEYVFDSSGQHTVEFVLERDNLPVDNRRFQVVTVREAVEVLCVEGKTNAARNVALALAPTDDSNVRVRVIAEHRLSETVLDEYDVLFLCNLGRFTAARATQLRDFLQRGRSVVMFLGDLSSPENYNQLLGGNERSPALLPAMLTEVSPYGSHRFSPRDYRHPIIAPFRGQERAGLLTTPVWQYVRMEIPEDTQANRVLEFTNGDPAIVEHSVLGGQLTLVAIAPSEQSVSRTTGQTNAWTAWSAWPSFPPMIQEMLTFSIRGQDQARNRLVGDPLSSSLSVASGAQFVTVQLPDASHRRVAVQKGQGPPTWIYDETHLSGFYAVEIPDDDATTDRFAVNLADTSESQLQRIGVSDLPGQFLRNSIAASSGAESTNAQLASTPLFRLLLGLLAILLLTETWLAWYLGNARA